MATEEIKEMPKSWAMVGGDGPQSYTQNSSYQVHILPLIIIIIIIAILKHFGLPFFFVLYFDFFFNFII
jgi:indole-3-acetate O-methyltransferase